MTRLKLPNNVCKAFWAAVLLTADTAFAEEAVQEAILSLDMEDLSTDALLICVATLSIQRSYCPEATGNQISLKLPEELRNVLKLPRMLRQCFVLRFLLGLPESICASLLHRDRQEICDATCAAASELSAEGSQRIALLASVPMIEQAAKLDAHHSIG